MNRWPQANPFPLALFLSRDDRAPTPRPLRRERSVSTRGRTARSAALASVFGAVAARYLLDSIVGRGSSLGIFADYALLMTLGVLLGLVAPLGLPEVGNRIVAKLVREGNRTALRSYLWLSSTLSITLGFFLAGVVALIMQMVMDVPSSLPFALCILAPSMAFLNVRRAQSLQLEGGNAVLFAPAISTGAAGVALAALLLADLTVSLILIAASVAITNILVAAFVCRTTIEESSDPGKKPSVSEQLRWIRSGSSAVANAVGTLILTQGDIIVVGLFAGPRDAGAYAAASRLALVVTLALGGLIPREAPILGRFIAAEDFTGAWAHYREASRLSGAAGTVICLFLVVGGSPLLNLFVPGSGLASGWLTILAFGRLGSAFVGPAAELLIALGAQELAARSSWLGVGTAVVLMLALGQQLGPLGIAIGTTAGMLIRSSLHYYFARRRCLAESLEVGIT